MAVSMYVSYFFLISDHNFYFEEIKVRFLGTLGGGWSFYVKDNYYTVHEYQMKSAHRHQEEKQNGFSFIYRVIF